MNSTRLRALAMTNLRWYCANQIGLLMMGYSAAISYRAQEWLPLAASLAVGSISLLAMLDRFRNFLKYRRLYRIQAEEESRWTR